MVVSRPCTGKVCEVKFKLNRREPSDLLLAFATVTVPSRAFTAAPTYNEMILNDCRTMLGTNAGHQCWAPLEPLSPGLVSSLLPPPLHIPQ